MRITPIAFAVIFGLSAISCSSSPQGPQTTNQQDSENVKVETVSDVQAEPTQEVDSSERLEELNFEKTEIENRISEINSEMAEAQAAEEQFSAQEAQAPGIGDLIPGGAAGFEFKALDAAAFGIDADALQDLIDAAMDGDVAGIIDAVQDLVDDLAAELADLQAQLDDIKDQIQDLVVQ